MKTNMKIIATVLIAFASVAFTTVGANKKAIKTDNSKVVWKGYKVTGEHAGTIAIKSGHLNFTADKLSGGEVLIDMTSIVNTDMEGEYKGKLEGHLKSDDFFGVAKYPTAKLILKKVTASKKDKYEVMGDLTIKNKTNPITFTVSIDGNRAKANIKIDRSKFDVRYGSTSFFDDLKDKAIYDEFDLIADIQF